jgi:hypothetical protein
VLGREYEYGRRLVEQEYEGEVVSLRSNAAQPIEDDPEDRPSTWTNSIRPVLLVPDMVRAGRAPTTTS